MPRAATRTALTAIPDPPRPVRPPADLPGLHINTHARPPTADYRCRCGFTDAASGDGIPALTKRIDNHRAQCPNTQKGNP